MKFNPNHHHRRSIRLPKYDYSRSGIYFVTICTHQKSPWFGEIIEDKIYHNQIGKIAVQEWLLSSEIRKEIELDEWVLMPNHLHGIVIINQDNDGSYRDNSTDINAKEMGANTNAKNLGASLAPLSGRKPRSLSSFVAGFKSAVTKRVRQICQESDLCIWQRKYYQFNRWV